MIPRLTAGTREDTRTAPAGFDRRLIAPMVLGSVLNPINSSMIAVALVPIGIAFGAPPDETVWLVTALYRQADPERIGSAAGLLRTFMHLGAPGASAATAAFYPHRAATVGLHGLALFMLAGSALLLAITLPDRSLARLTPQPRQAPRKA
nr:hypothetical protein [Streptomyces hyaluromycini]